MLVSILVALAVLYLVVVLGIAWLSLHPLRTPVFISPGSMGAPHEEVVIKTPSHILRGWWVPAEREDVVCVFVHGYLMNRAEMTPVAFQMWRLGIPSLLIDFRAHGRSGGRSCTLGFREREDVKDALRYTRDRLPKAKIVLVGSSMGAAASALALADEPGLAEVLVMDSGYSRLSNAVLGWWRFLGGRTLMTILAPTVYFATPMAGFNPFKVDIAQALAKIGPKPILHLHGTKDSLALPTEAERNHAACVGPSELVWFEGYGHSEYRWEQPETYLNALLAFLRKHGILADVSDPNATFPMR
ncbi:MAG TPA: alpha/beta hydrolase [Fimbriimonas sp.]|nr:alpha/beta hydrolase [Fimbriimonas sp.]